MAIQVACDCGKLLKASASLAGKRGRCPFCGAKVSIPPLTVKPAAPPAPVDVPGNRPKQQRHKSSDVPVEDQGIVELQLEIPARRGRLLIVGGTGAALMGVVAAAGGVLLLKRWFGKGPEAAPTDVSAARADIGQSRVDSNRSDGESTKSRKSPATAISVQSPFKMLPIAGEPLHMWRKSAGKPDLDVSVMNRITERMAGFPPHDWKLWFAAMSRVTEQKLDFKQLSSLDIIVGIVGELDETSTVQDVLGYVRFLAERMALLFDRDEVKPDVAKKLLKRLDSLTPADVNQWHAAFEKIVEAKVSKVFVAGIVLPIDALYQSDQYSSQQAQKLLRRLNQVTKEDVRVWIEKVDRFGGTQLDAALNIAQLDFLFDDETFNATKLHEWVAAFAAAADAESSKANGSSEQDATSAAAEAKSTAVETSRTAGNSTPASALPTATGNAPGAMAAIPAKVDGAWASWEGELQIIEFGKNPISSRADEVWVGIRLRQGIVVATVSDKRFLEQLADYRTNYEQGWEGDLVRVRGRIELDLGGEPRSDSVSHSEWLMMPIGPPPPGSMVVTLTSIERVGQSGSTARPGRQRPLTSYQIPVKAIQIISSMREPGKLVAMTVKPSMKPSYEWVGYELTDVPLLNLYLPICYADDPSRDHARSAARQGLEVRVTGFYEGLRLYSRQTDMPRPRAHFKVVSTSPVGVPSTLPASPQAAD